MVCDGVIAGGCELWIGFRATARHEANEISSISLDRQGNRLARCSPGLAYTVSASYRGWC